MCSDVTGLPLVAQKNRDNAVNGKDGFGLDIVYYLRSNIIYRKAAFYNVKCA